VLDPTSLLNWEGAVSLLSLSAMEIVLGIDNIVFIAILSQKVRPAERRRLRRTGLFLALFIRIGLLMTLKTIMGLTRPWFQVMGHDFAGRDLVLLGGGLFLMVKATLEIYDKVEAAPDNVDKAVQAASFGVALVQILALDIVFSLDSVITAVGMVAHLPIMIAAMVVAMLVMLVAADAVSGFINRHPSMKVLALSFLLLIGVLLTGEAFDRKIPKGYVYFAMAFSLAVEMLNMRMRRGRSRPTTTMPDADG